MPKSRAEYFRKRRETRGQFMVMVDKELLEKFNNQLKQIGKTKTEWLREKIEGELNND